MEKSGSPPHTWRKLDRFETKYHMIGITSTYMEKTLSTLIHCQRSWDHLHIRGENVWIKHTLKKRLGSPPHTWRKRILSMSNRFLCRITSTYVEKTKQPVSPVDKVQDHLHIRGENVSSIVQTPNTLGSPPHTWRKLPENDTDRSILGDHLHIRGENTAYQCLTYSILGSPPHTWRKRYDFNNSATHFRITSTYVEKTTTTRYQ